MLKERKITTLNPSRYAYKIHLILETNFSAFNFTQTEREAIFSFFFFENSSSIILFLEFSTKKEEEKKHPSTRYPNLFLPRSIKLRERRRKLISLTDRYREGSALNDSPDLNVAQPIIEKESSRSQLDFRDS